MKVQHFVLTRFNLRIDSFIARFSGGRWKGGDEDYLERRFDFFERFCLPSMSKQQVPFKWLVFFSEMTPERYKVRARAYADVCNGFEAVFAKDATPFDSKAAFSALMDEIVLRLDPDTDYYIVSRIDNDDAFNVHALEWIRAAALEKIEEDPCEKFYVVMPHGNAYILDGGFTQDYTWTKNHFPTLVCRTGVLDNPFSRSHTKICETGVPLVYVPNRHAWLEIVNGTNALNGLRISCRPEFLSADAMRELFAIDVRMNRFAFSWYWLSRYLPNKVISRLLPFGRRKVRGRN